MPIRAVYQTKGCRSRVSVSALALLASLVVAGSGGLACGSSDDSDIAETSQARATAVVELGLNDVSILFPIEATGFARTLPGVSASGAKGVLVPLPVLKPFEDLLNFDWSDLRAVGVRFDPCANIRVAKEDASCERELRIVFQGVFADPVTGNATAVQDFNVHAIYKLADIEFRDVVSRLRSMKAAAGEQNKALGLPLQPQPVITKEGLGGPYATGVLEIIRAYAGERNLTRVAFMDESTQSSEWTFALLDVKAGKPIKRTIPTLKKPRQTLQVNQIPPFSQVMPRTSSKDDLMGIQDFLGADNVANSVKKSDAESALEKTYRIENPSIHDASTIDCSSCHLATVTRFTLEDSGFRAPSRIDEFVSARWNLKAVSREIKLNEDLQMFSYKRGGVPEASIRQRVINESAVAADYIRTRLK